ncbi:MAG: molybdate ABC transporter substrate-binding protein [Alphaproteobacteria bacterium]|nr:molybdate ABC transporter substrate-binding protein [Alphaproteobacteria bacterium]
MTTGRLTKVLSNALSAALISVGLLVAPGIAKAETALVAVASNFIEAANKLSADFASKTGHTVTISTGSTGQLYAQILNGAPFDVFLSADAERPEKLEQDGIAVSGSRFTFALGQLAFWQKDPGFRVTAPDRISRNPVETIAIANPKLAPYGRAAQQVMEKQRIKSARVVYGQNIAQTFAMVATGNADAGYVARSQVMLEFMNLEGTSDLEQQKSDFQAKAFARGIEFVHPTLHDPIRQDAVLLKRAKDNPAALAFMAFLKAPETRKTIASFGYLDGDR